MSATAVILAPGETLGGFRLEEVIGVGGMAVVYRATQLSLEREVAVKVLSPELTTDEVFSERFRREGTHVAQLDHPNIVPIYDAGEDQGRLFLTMRLVEGMTLAERMRTRPLSASETLEILGSIAEGLDAAHAIGLVHRDIKPQNILVTDGGHPYLADFGVAKGVESAGLTASGGFVGTLHYAAPEQILGSATTPATDVYALTAVLFHCLTGAVPYPRDTQFGVIYAQVNQPPPQLPLPEALEFNLLIARGMAKAGGDRYASAGELIAAAERAVQGLPAEYLTKRPAFSASPESSTWPSEPVTPPQPARSTGQRSARRLGTARGRILAMSACLALLAGALVAASLGGRAAAAAWRTAHSASLTIHYRRPWTTGRAAFAAFAVTPTGRSRAQAPIELKSGLATLAAGSLAESAPVPGGVPPVLAARFGRPLRSTRSLAGGAAVHVFTWDLSGVRDVSAWVVPTVRGDLAIICSAPVGMPRLFGGCEALARNAHVSGSALLPLGPYPALARSLGRILTDANLNRHMLSGMYRASQGSAYVPDKIAAADAHAARSLSRLDVPARYRRELTSLASGFTSESRALRKLAQASSGSDRHRYGIDAKRVRSTGRRLEALTGALRREGLLAFTLRSLQVPAMPPPVTTPNPAPSAGPTGTNTVNSQPTTTTPYVPPTTTNTTPTTPKSGTGTTSGPRPGIH